jgi:hypothetical protein
MAHNSNNGTTRNFTFTLYNISEEESDKLEELVNNRFCKSLIYTHELGENGNNHHIQGYLITYTPNRISSIKNKINNLFTNNPNPHIEKARGSSIDNLRYITKELTIRPNAKHRVYGEPILPIGKKRDDNKFESYVDLLEKGEIKIKEIEEKDRAHFIRHENYYTSLISSLAKVANKPPTFVAWFSGSTGTGKSYTARQIAKTLGYDIYEAGVENNFFNRYEQQDCSIWDDYRSGPITFNQLLNITDKYGCMINIKGTKVFFNPRIQIFTSPLGIDSAKTKDMINSTTLDSKFEQLQRRVKYTAKFFHDQEGKSVIPSFNKVQEISNLVEKEFLAVFKRHLIDTNFEQYAQAHEVLRAITPINFKPLVEISTTCTLKFISNVSKPTDDIE